MGLFSPGFFVSTTLLAGFVLARYAASAAESISVVVELTNQLLGLLAIDTLHTLIGMETAVPPVNSLRNGGLRPQLSREDRDEHWP